MSAIFLLALAVLGAAISFYFTLAYYGWLESPHVPAALCRREERSCVTILATPYARVLGVPNTLVGIGFYLLTGIVAGLALNDALPHWLWLANLVGAAAAVLLAPYLIWALAARLRTWCAL